MRPIIQWFLNLLTSLPSVDLMPDDGDEYETLRRARDRGTGADAQLMYGGWQPWDPTNPHPSYDD